MNEADAHPHVPDEHAELFTVAAADGSTETEYADLIAAVVRARKPLKVLETGTGSGGTTRAIARALRANGRGELWSIEQDAGAFDGAARQMDSVPRWREFVHLMGVNSIDFIRATPETFDVAFLDSDLRLRADELELLMQCGRLADRAIVMVHDTSRLRTWDDKPDPATAIFWRKLDGLPFNVIEFPLSRGLVILQRRR